VTRDEKRELVEMPLAEMAAETQRLQAASGKGAECPNCGCRDVRHVGKPRPVCRNCGQEIFAWLPIPPKTKVETP